MYIHISVTLLTKYDQLGFHGLEVNNVEGTDEHRQGDQQHGGADTEEDQGQCLSGGTGNNSEGTIS